MSESINPLIGLLALLDRLVVPVNLGDIQLKEKPTNIPPAAPEQQAPSAPVAYEMDQ